MYRVRSRRASGKSGPLPFLFLVNEIIKQMNRILLQFHISFSNNISRESKNIGDFFIYILVFYFEIFLETYLDFLNSRIVNW